MDAYAELNHGRWIIPCPNCASAAYCEPRAHFFIVWGEPFCCVECGVENVRVHYPTPDMRLAVEQAVRVRPDDKYRNWQPGESIPFLLRENAERGH